MSLVSEAMVEAFYLAGTASQCRARLAEYRAAGVDLPLLLPRLEDYQATVEALRGGGVRVVREPTGLGHG